jgi:hypothetical protein
MLVPIITDSVMVCEGKRLYHWVLMILCQIYRCWTVYGRSRLIAVLPLLLLLYNMSGLIIMTYRNTIYSPTGNEPISRYDGWRAIVGSYFAATITINVYATCK